MGFISVAILIWHHLRSDTLDSRLLSQWRFWRFQFTLPKCTEFMALHRYSNDTLGAFEQGTSEISLEALFKRQRFSHRTWLVLHLARSDSSRWSRNQRIQAQIQSQIWFITNVQENDLWSELDHGNGPNLCLSIGRDSRLWYSRQEFRSDLGNNDGNQCRLVGFGSCHLYMVCQTRSTTRKAVVAKRQDVRRFLFDGTLTIYLLYFYFSLFLLFNRISLFHSIHVRTQTWCRSDEALWSCSEPSIVKRAREVQTSSRLDSLTSFKCFFSWRSSNYYIKLAQLQKLATGEFHRINVLTPGLKVRSVTNKNRLKKRKTEEGI